MLQIYNDIYLDADEHNVILYQGDISKDDKGRMPKAKARYYHNLDSALTGLLNIKTKEAILKSSDVSALIEEVKSIISFLKETSIELTNWQR
jgi:hypothetical protein